LGLLNRLSQRADITSVPGYNRRRRARAVRTEDAGRRSRSDGGFTLIELTVAMGLSAFVFAALAATMMGGVRSLAVAKARTQGNEVATQAIEDLQRFGYEKLGHCTAPPTPPEGLTDWVQLTGGCGGATVEDSCVSPSGVAISASYVCPRNNVNYDVKRYIAWSNPEQTAKRLAVFVSWTDQVGTHTVSQQSSVRAPSIGSVIGLSPPVVTNAMLTPANATIAPTGTLVSSVGITVDAQGLNNTDQVLAIFSVLDAYGEPAQDSFFLSSASGSQWSGTLTAAQGFRFGAGTQYVTITAIRAKDGKQTSTIASQMLTTCGSPCTTPPSPPALSSPSAPATISLYPSGALKNDVTVTVITVNVTPDDRVTLAFMTQSGMSTLPMAIDPAASCTVSSCRWKTTITASSGYAFNAGTRPFYFTAQQVKSTDPTSVDQGSTVALSGPGANGVTFA
jgi:type II secretory pathway pseudopilin PulG